VVADPNKLLTRHVTLGVPAPAPRFADQYGARGTELNKKGAHPPLVTEQGATDKPCCPSLFW